jgi:centriolar protein POC1
LRKGLILYTLYGHEGPARACNFSPEGDFFCTGGDDTNILIWQTNLQTETGISDLVSQPPLVQTKAKLVSKVKSESKVPISMKKEPASIKKSPAKQVDENDLRRANQHQAPEHEAMAKTGNFTYSALPEELAETMQKIVNQLDNITKTLGLIEQRVEINEGKIAEFSEYFKAMGEENKPEILQKSEDVQDL